jgi:dienelactone hydrolase
LLFDLLSEREGHSRSHVFDVALLASRLADGTAWIRAHPACGDLPIGYFGASTGAAAALVAAADPRNPVAAVVSRGGRPDLAAAWLPKVHVPTLLIVGGMDDAVLELNRRAQQLLAGPSRLEIVPGATHLFAEPGALDRVARLARTWFHTHLAATASVPDVAR